MSRSTAPWIEKQSLGKGTFGSVWLYVNEETNEKVALKKCTRPNDEKVRDWWKKEVAIMPKLQHDNVIAVLPTPPELKPDDSQLPVMTMEYCEGGDLRKVLNQPHNCFGLSEAEVRQLASGVGSALSYLHSSSITHRDLKPENIVLKPLGDRTIYKVIDLGYAKELDMNSLCNSYVGTQQYLAPEVHKSAHTPYTKKVDYWAFGLIVFECISGFRPFLPQLNHIPYEWWKNVSKKSRDDISVQYDEKSNLIYSQELPSRTNLCSPLKDLLEQWLRLMLRWNPAERGEPGNCFAQLQKILDLKILTALNVETNSLLSYEITDQERMHDVIMKIHHQTKLPVEAHTLVLASGVRLHPEEPALLGQADSMLDEPKVFLFNDEQKQIPPTKACKLPPNMNTIVREPQVLLGSRAHLKAWAEAVYWFTQENKVFQRLFLAYRAALLNLMRNNSGMLHQREDLERKVSQLSTCKKFFKESLDFDICKCQETMQVYNQLTGELGGGLVKAWTQVGVRLDTLDTLIEQAKTLCTQVGVVNRGILDLQALSVSSDELKEFETRAKELYTKLQRSLQEDNPIQDHKQMVDLVAECFLKRDGVTKAIYEQISVVSEHQRRLQPLLSNLNQSVMSVNDAITQMFTLQKQRQEELWSFIRHPLQPSQTSRGELDKLDGVSMQFQHSFSLFDSVSMCSNPESMQLLSESRQVSQRASIIVSDMLREQEEGIHYLSSLNQHNRTRAGQSAG